MKSSQPRRVRTPTRNVLHLSARQPKPSITPSLRGAALEIKRCRSFGLPTPPLASSPQLTRATRLPALTGKSMSNLRGSLRRSRMPSGARTAPHALGYRPARTTSPPSQLGRGSEKSSDTLQVRARQADPIITCHYSRRQVSTQPLRRGALEASPTHQSSTASSRRAAVEDKTNQASQPAALALTTTPPSSSLRLMRVTRLPALTGKSTSKLARSLRQRRVLEGTSTAPPASGHHPYERRRPRRHSNLACHRVRERRRTRWVITRCERHRPSHS